MLGGTTWLFFFSYFKTCFFSDTCDRCPAGAVPGGFLVSFHAVLGCTIVYVALGAPLFMICYRHKLETTCLLMNSVPNTTKQHRESKTAKEIL